jgi:hypothetical protein
MPHTTTPPTPRRSKAALLNTLLAALVAGIVPMPRRCFASALRSGAALLLRSLNTLLAALADEGRLRPLVLPRGCAAALSVLPAQRRDLAWIAVLRHVEALLLRTRRECGGPTSSLLGTNTHFRFVPRLVAVVVEHRVNRASRPQPSRWTSIVPPCSALPHASEGQRSTPEGINLTIQHTERRTS